jgi:hypothetical protein
MLESAVHNAASEAVLPVLTRWVVPIGSKVTPTSVTDKLPVESTLDRSLVAATVPRSNDTAPCNVPRCLVKVTVRQRRVAWPAVDFTTKTVSAAHTVASERVPAIDTRSVESNVDPKNVPTVVR